MEEEELPVEVGDDDEYDDPYEDDRKYLIDVGYITETYSD